jgi:hypothetical protein
MAVARRWAEGLTRFYRESSAVVGKYLRLAEGCREKF